MSLFINIFYIFSIRMISVLAKKSSTSTSTTPTDVLKPILSEFWTEGLIICLIVSLMLIAILVIAIKATSSISISYGALEDKTQNQDSNKKIN
ncbi:hypothetical protein DAHU10_000200 [Hanseniaspora uvarum]|nr:hypothetical protein DAHU10_000200 [Hanseniaspora uvarum]